jgi:hypothetical protein
MTINELPLTPARRRRLDPAPRGWPVPGKAPR